MFFRHIRMSWACCGRIARLWWYIFPWLLFILFLFWPIVIWLSLVLAGLQECRQCRDTTLKQAKHSYR